VDMLYILCK